MIDRKRLRDVFRLALPIIGGMASQNLLNLVDTAMVGTLGSSALAGVGIASFASFTCMAFIMGLSSSVQAISARRIGEDKSDQAAESLNGALLISLLVGLPLSLGLYWAIPSVFPYLNSDPSIIREGVPYLQVRILCMVAVGMNFAFRGFWNATEKASLYMFTLIVMHVCNITLDWLLIFGHWGFPKYGAMGAGLATTISTVIGTLLYFVLGAYHAKPFGFLKRFPNKATFQSLIRLSIPSGLQQLLFAAGMLVFFIIIGKIGKEALAASNVIVQLLLVMILVGIGFGIASATMVGKAIGQKNPEEAEEWGWNVAKIASLIAVVMSLPGIFFPDAVLSLFIQEPLTIQMASTSFRVICLFIAFDIFGLVLMQSLYGAGDAKNVMLVSLVLQWGLSLPLCFVVANYTSFGLIGIWTVHIGYRFLQTLCFVFLWKRGHWKTIQL